MTEEINHSYDGGLYAELIRNRAFLDDASSPAHWSAVHGDGAAAAISLDPTQALNAAMATSLRLEVTRASSGHPAGVANEGYWGIPVRPNTRLTLGYTLLFLNDIARAPSQVDFNINPGNFPPPTGAGPANPAFSLNQSNIWIQSINVGMLVSEAGHA